MTEVHPRNGEMLSRIRNFLLDSQVESPYHMAQVLGIPPISDDVAESEEDASNERVGRIALLIPLIQTYGRTMAKAHILHTQSHMDEETLAGMQEGVWDATARQYASISINAMIGAISQMVESGVLVLPKQPKKGWFRK